MKTALKMRGFVLEVINEHMAVGMRVVAILAFAVATAVTAQIHIPVPGSPVPVTLQTFIVLLAGLKLGRKDGAISQAVYIAAGAIGLPFFAGAAGLAVLFGPTGGYL